MYGTSTIKTKDILFALSIYNVLVYIRYIYIYIYIHACIYVHLHGYIYRYLYEQLIMYMCKDMFILCHILLFFYVTNLHCRLGKECGFKEENEIAVAIKYAKEQG